MKPSKIVKMQTFCPVEALEQVRLAIGDAGAGKMGNYSHCSFVSSGFGHFLPLTGANPAIGEVGKPETVEEYKIEFVCEIEKVNDVMSAIKRVHPYEEVPIDIFQMLDLEDEVKV